MLSCPVEILCTVFLELTSDPSDLSDLRACLSVCRRFRECIKSSLKMQTHLRCHELGYQVSGRSPSPNLLETLNQHVRNWRSLDWEEQSFDIPFDGPFALSHGVFVVVSESFPTNFREVKCVTLPSRMRGTAGGIHTLYGVEIEPKDIAIDPSQDLLVLVEEFYVSAAIQPLYHLELSCTYLGSYFS